MELRVKFLLSYIGSLIFTIILYIFLHELGHSIVAIACGAHNVKISIIEARMTYYGGNFNQITESLLHIAGMLLPVLLCFMLNLFYNKKTNNMFYIYFSFIFSIGATGSILAWIIVPFLSLFTTPPASDDVTKFINSSQIHPFIIILVAISLITIMVLTAFMKGIVKNSINLSKSMKQVKTTE